MIKKNIGFLLFSSLVIFLTPFSSIKAEESTSIHNEIIYEILVDRFNNGNTNETVEIDVKDPNSYHGGDIQGVIDQLDRLYEMGITTISLSPLMENEQDGYHGYWITDYFAVEEQLGTKEELDQLIEEAHNRDMKVVMDFSMNYASVNHEFVGDNDKSSWWKEPEYTEFDWLDEAIQWDLNQPEIAAYIMEAADYWIEGTDLDGFTLHAVDQVSIEFLHEFTSHIKEEHPNFYLIGDIVDGDTADIAAIEETALDVVSNPFLHQTIKQVFSNVDNPVLDVIEQWEDMETGSPLITIDSFLEERFTNAYSKNQRNSLTAWTLALTFMYTTPGPPQIVQGTELPMYAGNEEESQRLVPFNSGDPEVEEFHTRMASLRNEFPALRLGDFEFVDAVDSMVVFKRSYEGQTMYVAINNGSESAHIDVNDVGSDKQLRGYLNDNLARENDEGNHRIGIPRESVEVYEVVDDEGLNWGLIGFISFVLLTFVIGVVYLSIKQRKRERK